MARKGTRGASRTALLAGVVDIGFHDFDKFNNIKSKIYCMKSFKIKQKSL